MISMRSQSAFSLVELSIVLVILGLLVGGILGGQALIRAAELRAVSTEYARWVTATQTFRDKYLAFPGDMANATAFWGAGACPGDASPSAGTATCNGDGNGSIIAYGPTFYTEPLRFWQHLANAGLIEGTYTGVRSTAGLNRSVAVGLNIPRSKVNTNAGWYIESMTTGSIVDPPVDSTSLLHFEGSYGSFFTLGSAGVTANQVAVLTPEDAWNIDTKMDDGRPGTGQVMTMENGGVNCNGAAASAAPLANTVSYNLAVRAVSCTLVFPRIFQ